MNKPIRYSKRIRGENPEYGLYTNQCSVCLENKQNDIFYDNAYCDHNICMGCQDRWSETSIKCPTCQKSLVSVEETVYDYDEYDNKLYHPLYFHFTPPPRWLGTICVILFRSIHSIIWFKNSIFFGDDDEKDEEDEDNRILEQIDRLNMALE